MKLFTLLISTLFISSLHSEAVYLSLEDSINSSTIIVIGQLKNVVRTKSEESTSFHGVIEIEETLKGFHKDSKVDLKWSQEDGVICPVVNHGKHVNKTGIWMLMKTKKMDYYVGVDWDSCLTLKKKEKVLQIIKNEDEKRKQELEKLKPKI